MVDAILATPFLLGPMLDANTKYSLGLDLSAYEAAAAAAAAALHPPTAPAAVGIADTPPLPAAGLSSSDRVLMATCPARPMTELAAASPTAPPTPAAGADHESEYEEEFEDYSG